MHSTLLKRSLLSGAALLAALLVLPVVAKTVQAEDTPTTNSAKATEQRTAEQKERELNARQEVEKKAAAAKKELEQRQATAKTKLDDAKRKVCQNREKTITGVMNRQSSRGENHLQVFTKIAERTEAFYVQKGKTLANYDALVAEVNIKKAAAQAAVDIAKNASVQFNCDGTDPKGIADLFKANVAAEHAALKEYRAAIKNLIAGVKSVQSTAKSTDGSQQ